MRKEHYVMKWKSKWIILLFCLVFAVVVIASPVSGAVVNIHDNSHLYNVSYSFYALYIWNVSVFDNAIDKIEISDIYAPNGSIPYATFSDTITIHGGHVSPVPYIGTGSYDQSCAGDVCSATIYFDMGLDTSPLTYTPGDYITFDLDTHATSILTPYFWGDFDSGDTNEYGIDVFYGGLRMTGHYIIYGREYLAPECSFTTNTTSGISPLAISFTDTSANSPTAWNWFVSSNGTTFEEHHSTLQSFEEVLYNPSTYDVVFAASNVNGSCNLFYPNYITVAIPVNATFTLNVVDALTHSLISGADVGIQNTTSGLWTNATAATGTYTFTSTDGALELPLRVGQTFIDIASAVGYIDASHSITLPYSGYSDTIALMPVTAINETGTFWLTVTVTKNEDGKPLNSAVVQVISGGNNYQQYTADDGMTTFQNITSGITFSVSAFAQAYSAQTKVLPKDADFMNTSFSLVRKYGTPVPTPGTPATTQTPMVVYTNAAGQPISSSEGQALNVFDQLAAALGGWVGIGIGIVQITLLWMVVYAITGGKIIDKIMRRGRGGRRRRGG